MTTGAASKGRAFLHQMAVPLCILASQGGRMLGRIHHVAIICSDYAKSKRFYSEILGLKVLREIYREERRSYKLDLQVGDHDQIELFSFPNPPARPSRPEACGLRHLAFEVDDVEATARTISGRGIDVEPIRIDQTTGKAFTFFADPDDLPIEIYGR
jgi:glyoxylase I family protein